MRMLDIIKLQNAQQEKLLKVSPSVTLSLLVEISGPLHHVYSVLEVSVLLEECTYICFLKISLK